ncbi:hypothetical protein AAFF_G00026020 [Aldrovandia affinis]|uniref:Uncharacterized protein n=1 Tax=Aldrovandia affinis TaxID=143900 RepID=A0AAD7S4X8_9TELE|nr:hypothetical protein AAFF_G00026020 [Aldrovandia affinis]
MNVGADVNLDSCCLEEKTTTISLVTFSSRQEASHHSMNSSRAGPWSWAGPESRERSSVIRKLHQVNMPMQPTVSRAEML